MKISKRSSLANLSQVPFRLSFKRCTAQNGRHQMWPGGGSTSTPWTHVSLCHWFYLLIPDTAVTLGVFLRKKTPLCPTGEQPWPIPENWNQDARLSLQLPGRVAPAASHAAITPWLTPHLHFPTLAILLPRPPDPFLAREWIQWSLWVHSTAQLATWQSPLPHIYAHQTRGENKMPQCLGLSSQTQGQTGIPSDTL